MFWPRKWIPGVADAMIKAGINEVKYPYFTPVRRGFPMVSTLLFYQLLLVALVLTYLLMHVVWPDDPPRAPTPSPYSQNIRTRLPTGGYASTITRASSCFPLYSHPYSASI